MSTTQASPFEENPSFQSRDIFSEIDGAKIRLEVEENNLATIDGSSIDLPPTDQGRDFEIRLLLDIENPSTLAQFTESLPKRFQQSISFWGEYVGRLNRSFCQSFEVRYSMLNFSQTSGDQCSLFHADNVKVRLFQTLQGPGTEYLTNDNVRREGIGGGCNSKIVKDSSYIQRAKEKDILLMRGEKWYRGKGLVHRSPPVEQLGLKRLYLCIDAKKDLSEVRY